MNKLECESDLGNAYTGWLEYKEKGGGRECIRFGQYIYNQYNYEYKNSYNIRSDIDAYNLILKGLMGNTNESK